MKVTVTGAAGRLGSVVCTTLASAGMDLLATDRNYRADLPVRLRIADLLDRQSAYGLVEGADAVVHLGNHPGFWGGDAQRICNENVTMNFNVFEAARQCGVKRIVFASTIQVIAGARRMEKPQPPPSALPYLPLDGEVPPNPANPYALSKQLSEHMLAYFSRAHGMSCVAIRFPLLVSADRLAEMTGRAEEPWPNYALDEAFSYLSLNDAAQLVCAILRAELPGFRVYFPVSPRPLVRQPVAELIKRYFSNVPLRAPVEQITALVDVSRITAETGWRPAD